MCVLRDQLLCIHLSLEQKILGKKGLEDSNHRLTLENKELKEYVKSLSVSAIMTVAVLTQSWLLCRCRTGLQEARECRQHL